MSAPRISVVVCTRNRSAVLARCLAALERQTLPKAQFQTIVVDNGSTDETGAVLAAFCANNQNFKAVSEVRPGLSIARNRGVKESAAEIVAFTDDDAEPAPNWAQSIAEGFDSLPPDTGILGGEVTPVWETERPVWLSDALLRPLSAGLKWSPEARFLRNEEWLVEVNSGYRKSALMRIEGFPEHLGRVGDLLLSGDGAANILIQRAGFRLYYDPQILVKHHIPGSRVTQSWFRRRSFWQGVTMRLLHLYVDETSLRLGFGGPASRSRAWEEIRVPTSARAWADLFDDANVEAFHDQLYRLEQLGYLLESQSVLVGR